MLFLVLVLVIVQEFAQRIIQSGTSMAGGILRGLNLSPGSFKMGGCSPGANPACALIAGELTVECVEGVLTVTDGFVIPEPDSLLMVDLTLTDGEGNTVTGAITEAGGNYVFNDGDGDVDFTNELVITGVIATQECPDGRSFYIPVEKLNDTPDEGVLEVDKSFEVVGNPDGRPSAGDTVIFTATVMNTGTGPLIGVTATDAVPTGTTLVSAVPTQGTYSDPNWNVGDVAAGASVDLVMTVTIDAYDEASNITNTLTAIAEGGKETVAVTVVPVDCKNLRCFFTSDNDNVPNQIIGSTINAVGWSSVMSYNLKALKPGLIRLTGIAGLIEGCKTISLENEGAFPTHADLFTELFTQLGTPLNFKFGQHELMNESDAVGSYYYTDDFNCADHPIDEFILSFEYVRTTAGVETPGVTFDMIFKKHTVESCEPSPEATGLVPVCPEGGGKGEPVGVCAVRGDRIGYGALTAAGCENATIYDSEGNGYDVTVTGGGVSIAELASLGYTGEPCALVSFECR